MSTPIASDRPRPGQRAHVGLTPQAPSFLMSTTGHRHQASQTAGFAAVRETPGGETLLQRAGLESPMPLMPTAPPAPQPEPRAGRASGQDIRLIPLLHTMPELKPLSAVVGLTDKGRPLVIHLDHPRTQHVIIAAAAHQPAMELMRSILFSLALTSRPSQCQILAVDVDHGGRQLAVAQAVPHALTETASLPQPASEVLRWLAEERTHRASCGISRPHLCLFLAGLRWLMPSRRNADLRILEDLLTDGAAAGIHLILAAGRDILLDIESRLASAPILRADFIPDGGLSQAHRFTFLSGPRRKCVSLAWLPARDLNAAVRLAEAGWRAGRRPRRR